LPGCPTLRKKKKKTYFLRSAAMSGCQVIDGNTAEPLAALQGKHPEMNSLCYLRNKISSGTVREASSLQNLSSFYHKFQKWL
jgi:hypothetical protein